MGITAFGVLVFVAPYAKGADAKTAVFFFFADGFAQGQDDRVYIASPPVAFAQAVAIFLVGDIVAKFFIGLRVRVKIVVKMDGVYIVAAHDVADYFYHVL